MLLLVIQAGWLYQDRRPGREPRGKPAGGHHTLVVAEGAGEAVTPRAVVRAAKDHVLGLSCARSRPLGPSGAVGQVGPEIREVAVG